MVLVDVVIVVGLLIWYGLFEFDVIFGGVIFYYVVYLAVEGYVVVGVFELYFVEVLWVELDLLEGNGDDVVVVLSVVLWLCLVWDW